MNVVNLDTIEGDKRRKEVELEGELHVKGGDNGLIFAFDKYVRRV